MKESAVPVRRVTIREERSEGQLRFLEADLDAVGQPAGPPVSLAMCSDVGWPGIERYVRALERSAVEVGGEVIVADGSGNPPPPPESLGPATRWLAFPRSSIYELRPALLDACRADLIAMTEDYSLVEPGWAAAHLAAHAENPEVLAIGGPIDNLAVHKPLDWASFFVAKGGFAPPVATGPTRRIAHANVSYKRAALALAPKGGSMDILDSLDRAVLSAREGAMHDGAVHDGAMRMDPRPLVWHDQSMGVMRFLARHFRAGRKYGAFIRPGGGRRPMLRLLAAPGVPSVRLVRTASLVSRSRHANRLAPALPWMLVLLFAQALGQVTGILWGTKGRRVAQGPAARKVG